MGQAFLTTLLANDLFGAKGVAIGFVLNVIVFFVLTEAVPKTWAVLSAERAALFTARPIEWLVSFPPLRLVSRALIVLTNVLVPGKGLKEGPFVSEQELLGIVGAAADDEVIEHEERELIESIIEFGDTVVREVMVPRPDMLIVEQRRHRHGRPRPGDRQRGQPPAGAGRRRRRHRRPRLHQGPHPCRA